MLPVLWNVLSTASCLTGRLGLNVPTRVGSQVCVCFSQECLCSIHGHVSVALSSGVYILNLTLTPSEEPETTTANSVYVTNTKKLTQ